MTKKLVINGTGAPELVEMTADEETQRNSENNGEAKTTAFENKMSKLATDQKAGYDKLIELGLTADQVTALTGYAPPAE